MDLEYMLVTIFIKSCLLLYLHPVIVSKTLLACPKKVCPPCTVTKKLNYFLILTLLEDTLQRLVFYLHVLVFSPLIFFSTGF